MRIFIKQLGQHTFIFGIGNIIQGAISFLLLPVYLHYLRPSDYGIIALLELIAMITGSVILQSIPTSLFRVYSYDYLDNPQEQKEAVGSAFIYLIISSTICFGLLIMIAPFITSLVFKEFKPVSLVRLVLLTGLFSVPANIPLVVFRAKLMSKTMITISIIRGLVTIALNIFLVAYMKMNIAGMVWGNLIPSFVMFAISPALLKNDMTWKISFDKVKKMLAFGWPLVPGFLGGWILASSDRYLLEHLSTTYELGLYSLGYKFASILSLAFLGPFQIAWPAIFFPKAREDDALPVFRRFTTYFMLLGCGVALCLVAGSEPLIRLMGPQEYWRAHIVVPVLAMALLLGTGGLQEVLNVSLYIKAKTKIIPVIIGAGVLANIIMNILFIPYYGMMGSAVATLISMVLISVLTYIASHRYYQVTMEYKRIAMIVTLFTLLSILNYAVRIEGMIPMILYKGVLLAAYPALLLIGFFTADEKRAMSELLEKVMGILKNQAERGGC